LQGGCVRVEPQGAFDFGKEKKGRILIRAYCMAALSEQKAGAPSTFGKEKDGRNLKRDCRVAVSERNA
jgi:hypothetical protein